MARPTYNIVFYAGDCDRTLVVSCPGCQQQLAHIVLCETMHRQLLKTIERTAALATPGHKCSAT